MLSDDYIEVFSESLELKKRQVENYERLVKYRAGRKFVSQIIDDERAKFGKVQRVFLEVTKDLNTKKNPNRLGLKVKLDQAMSQLEKAWSKLEKQLNDQPDQQDKRLGKQSDKRDKPLKNNSKRKRCRGSQQ